MLNEMPGAIVAESSRHIAECCSLTDLERFGSDDVSDVSVWDGAGVGEYYWRD